MNRGRRPRYKELILRTLADAGSTGFDLMSAFIKSGYGASARKIEWEMEKTRSQRILNKEQEKVLVEEKRRFEKMVDYLRTQGLLVKEYRGKKKVLKITTEGKQWLGKRNGNSPASLPPHSYDTEPSDGPIVVVFDVPETERCKRDWLRNSLKNMGLRMIQKSVWVGHIKIPKRFLEDLKSQKIGKCVEIVEIRKTGTLEIETG